MLFPLGKPILVMLMLAAIGAVIVIARPRPKHADMTLWCFAESHVRSYVGDPAVPGEPPAARYTRLTGRSLDVVLINNRAEDVRLLSLFNNPHPGQQVPDAVEIEMSKIGKFFRPSVEDVGLLPLNDFLKKSGWFDQIVVNRLAPWSKQGVVFGIPHDLHPTTLTYRKDLFDEAGVDPGAAKTWTDLRDLFLRFKFYWQEHGKPRWPIGLSRTSPDSLIIMLQQRHLDLIDDRNRIFLNDPKVRQTLQFYAGLVGGTQTIGTDFNPAPGMNYRDLASGDICAMITPDWMAAYIKQYAPEVSGKVAMMPLPVFDPNDAPTASYGGTMIGIPRGCKDPQASWKLVESLYFDVESLDYRRKSLDLIPPIKKYWKDEVYQRGDPFFAGDQNINQLYISLANQLPAQHITPFTTLAQQMLAGVLYKAVGRTDDGRADQLDRDLPRWLDDAARELEQRVKFGTFED